MFSGVDFASRQEVTSAMCDAFIASQLLSAAITGLIPVADTSLPEMFHFFPSSFFKIV